MSKTFEAGFSRFSWEILSSIFCIRPRKDLSACSLWRTRLTLSSFARHIVGWDQTYNNQIYQRFKPGDVLRHPPAPPSHARLWPLRRKCGCLQPSAKNEWSPQLHELCHQWQAHGCSVAGEVVYAEVNSEHLMAGEVGSGQPGRLPQLLLRVGGRQGDQLDPGQELPLALRPADHQLCQTADQPCRGWVGQVRLPTDLFYSSMSLFMFYVLYFFIFLDLDLDASKIKRLLLLLAGTLWIAEDQLPLNPMKKTYFW